jgi:hypothetical protein
LIRRILKVPLSAELDQPFRHYEPVIDTKPMDTVNDAITAHAEEELRPYDGTVNLDNLNI